MIIIKLILIIQKIDKIALLITVQPLYKLMSETIFIKLYY